MSACKRRNRRSRGSAGLASENEGQGRLATGCLVHCGDERMRKGAAITVGESACSSVVGRDETLKNTLPSEALFSSVIEALDKSDDFFPKGCKFLS